MNEIKNKFGLRQKSTGKIVGYYTSQNSGDGVELQHILEPGAEKFWLVDDPEQAEFVRLNSTEWYNAGYDTPTNHIDTDDLEVVEINVEIKTTSVDVSLPTPYEFFETRYAEKDPRHWEYLKGKIKKDEGTRYAMKYSWYDVLLAREERSDEPRTTK